MKNKLTQEEKLFQQKLNEADFEYNAADWASMQDAMKPKGSFGNYSPFIKAVGGLGLFLGAVFIINTYYNNEEQPTTKTAEEIQIENVQTKKPTETKESGAISETEKTNDKADGGSPGRVAKNPSLIEKEEKRQVSKISNTATIAPVQTDRNEAEDKREPIVPFMFNKILSSETICLNEPVVFNLDYSGKISDEQTIFWYINDKKADGNGLKNILTFNAPGSYIISVKAFKDDKIVSTINNNVNVAAGPKMDFSYADSKDVFSDLEAQFKVLYPNSDNYVWSFGSGKEVASGKEVSHIFSKEGEYDVTLKHELSNGCQYSYTKAISIEKDFKEAFPDAFTPDGDGLNDVFELEVFRLRNDKYELKIFDFSGKQVFQSTNPEEGWNGRLNNTGLLLPDQTYAWVVEIENENGQKRIFKNKVKLIGFK